MSTFDEEASNLDLSELEPWRVTYPSDGLELTGYLRVPDGPGPFPAIIHSHGSGGLLPPTRVVFETLSSLNYVVFMPIRRGYNDNPGINHHGYMLSAEDSDAWDQEIVEGTLAENDDVLAALAWLKQQPNVDPQRVALSGTSWGGVMTLLAAGRQANFRAGISFAGPSITWPRAPRLQEALLDAVRQATVPLFLLQAQNDHSLAPTYTLGAELGRLGKVHELRVYPPLGNSAIEGHAMANTHPNIWRADVAAFLERWNR